MAGYLCVKFTNMDGEVEVEDLNLNGRHDAAYQCRRMIERLEELDDDEHRSEAEEVERLYAEAEKA